MTPLISQEFRRTFTLQFIATIVVIASVSALAGYFRVQNSAFRSDFDVFSTMMSSPLVLVFPIAAVFVSCIPMYHEVGHRYLANTRTRIDVRNYVHSKLAVACLIAFAASFLITFLAFALAFWVWPIIGNPGILPAAYGMTPAQAQADALTSASYSSVLAWGDLTYGFLYAVWVGVGGAVFSGLGIASLVLIENRVVALSLPFLAYIVETLLMALVDSPQLGIMYSLFPFGITQQPMAVSVMPMVVFLLATVALWVWLTPRLRHSKRLI
jgi:hypothetical protein